MSSVISDDRALQNLAANVARILIERRALGLHPATQAELARATGENEMRISKLVRGVNMPEVGFAARVAEALGISLDDLVREPQESRLSA